MTAIAKLRNLGPISAAMLSDIGIKTEEDLKNQDVVDTYVLLKSFGFKVDNNMLWALYGALNDCDWRELDSTVKSELLSKLEDI